MKKLFLLLCLCIGLFSCSSDIENKELIPEVTFKIGQPELVISLDANEQVIISDLNDPNKLLDWTIICADGNPKNNNSGNFCATDGKGHYVTVNWYSGIPRPDNNCGGHSYAEFYSGGHEPNKLINYCSTNVSFCKAC